MKENAVRVGPSRAIPLSSHQLKAATPMVARKIDARTVAEAFPNIDPGIRPCGERLTVQLRTPLAKTAGGVHLTDTDRETEMWNEQCGLVRFVGPLAFRKREDMTPWPEGAWCKEGDFVRIPRYHADRIMVSTGPRSEDIAIFVTLKDTEVLAVVVGDPLSIKAFL